MKNVIQVSVDVGVIVLCAFLPRLLYNSNVADVHAFDGTLVAFAAALALSVFPACKLYDVEEKRSYVLISRTAIAWVLVQLACTILLYVLHRREMLSSLWFAYWAITSGIGLVIFRAVTLGILEYMQRAGRRVHGVATGQFREPRIVQRIIKRGFDIVAASALVVLLAPVLVVIALLVRRDGGSATYGHVRIGRGGIPFSCLKFRSMVPNADVVLRELLNRDPDAAAQWEREFKLKNDTRITPIGRVLRKTSLDELPQLLNVIKGEMSLVGPRPVVEDELERYGDNVRYYLMVKPGMTGLWQVSGRNDVDYSTRVLLDVSYVKELSISSDFRILFRTIGVVLRGAGAY